VSRVGVEAVSRAHPPALYAVEVDLPTKGRGPDRPAEATAKPPSEGKGGLKK